jgi:hypothetical protein
MIKQSTVRNKLFFINLDKAQFLGDWKPSNTDTTRSIMIDYAQNFIDHIEEYWLTVQGKWKVRPALYRGIGKPVKYNPAKVKAALIELELIDSKIIELAWEDIQTKIATDQNPFKTSVCDAAWFTIEWAKDMLTVNGNLRKKYEAFNNFKEAKSA